MSEVPSFRERQEYADVVYGQAGELVQGRYEFVLVSETQQEAERLWVPEMTRVQMLWAHYSYDTLSRAENMRQMFRLHLRTTGTGSWVTSPSLPAMSTDEARTRGLLPPADSAPHLPMS